MGAGENGQKRLDWGVGVGGFGVSDSVDDTVNLKDSKRESGSEEKEYCIFKKSIRSKA